MPRFPIPVGVVRSPFTVSTDQDAGFVAHTSLAGGRSVIGNRGADTMVNPANPATATDDPAVDACTIVCPPGGDATKPARVTLPNNFWYRVPRSYTLAATVLF
jgi:hypothetical protein